MVGTDTEAWRCVFLNEFLQGVRFKCAVHISHISHIGSIYWEDTCSAYCSAVHISTLSRQCDMGGLGGLPPRNKKERADVGRAYLCQSTSLCASRRDGDTHSISQLAYFYFAASCIFATGVSPSKNKICTHAWIFRRKWQESGKW